MKIHRFRLGIIKSVCASCIIVLSVACMLNSLPIAYAAISEYEGKEAAYRYCEEQFGYAKNELEIYAFTPRQSGGWNFGVKALEPDGTMKEIIRGEMDENGQLSNLEIRGDIAPLEQLLEDYVRSQRNHEAMYNFKQKWEERLSQLPHEEIVKLDRQSSFPFSQFVRHDVRLPSDIDIPYEVAKKKSEEAILSMSGWTQDMLDHIRISLEVYHVPDGSDRSVYQFIYRVASAVVQVEAIISGVDNNSAYIRLEKAEKNLFGQATPWNINVRLDAKTGEQIGDIFIDTPPTKYTDLDFILWKWDGTP